jgi:hypothetical protein
MPHLQLGSVGFQCIVDPSAEQRGFHRAVPRLPLAIEGEGKEGSDASN